MALWWPFILEDCIFVIAHCDGCHIETAKFVAEPSLRPTDKPKAPLEGWSIDLITNMEPVSLERHHHCTVAIDCFTKWTEVGPI